MKKLEIKHYFVSDINPSAYNPRDISNDELSGLKESIKKFGLIDPLIVNIKDGLNVLCGGHQRLKVAEMLGYETVPVVEVDLGSTEEKALNLALNSHTIQGKFNPELVHSLIDEIRCEIPELILDLRLDALERDLKIEIPAVEIIEEINGQDDVPDLTPDPIVKRGDIFQLGNHRLMCGDSVIINDVEKLMDGNLADFVFTDPPYNVNYKGSDGQSIKNDNMTDEIFSQFCQDFFNSYFTIMKNGASIYVFHADINGHHFRSTFLKSGFKLSSNLIWNKNALVIGRSDYHWKHEPCLYGWKPGAAHNWYSDRKQTTVFDHMKGSGIDNKMHPTCKPVSLVEYFLKNSSKLNDLCVDLFGGSGSLMIASEKNKRTCYTMEIDPKYCDVIIKRYLKFTGRSDVFLFNADGTKTQWSDLINK